VARARKRASVCCSSPKNKWCASLDDLQPESQRTAGAIKHGRRPGVFCASLADVFDNRVPPEWREDLFALIRECKRLDWLMLTKRPQNIRRMLPADWGDGYRNVWLGVTAENQRYFDHRWRILQNIPAVIEFIFYEPAFGHLHLPKHGPLPNWLISGGESGPKARPINPNWVHNIIAYCGNRASLCFTNSGEPTTVIRSSRSRA
jgi:protein gp37